MRAISTAVFLPLFFVGVLASLAGAQEGAPPIFIDRVDVNVVNIEVFVTDEDGRPVLGLGEEDFEIWEDGRQVEISNFFASARPERVLEDLERDRAMVEGRRRPAPRRFERPDNQRLQLIVYIDHFNIHPNNRKRVLTDLEGFVEDRLSQGDRIMLVGYDRSLEIVRPFSDDRQDLVEGLRSLGKVTGRRLQDNAERRRLMWLMQEAADNGDIDTAYQHVRSYVQSTRNDLEHSMEALGQVVRSLAGLPGRKAVLYVSDGLPMRPGEELFEHLQNLFSQQALADTGGGPGSVVDPSIEALREDQSQLFAAVTRDANAHQVTLYTLDARGSTGESTASAEFGSRGSGAAGRINFDTIRTFNLQEPLVEIAVATGGEAILNTFNFDDAFDDLGQDFDTFYSLGYRSPHGGDGKYHEIEVRTRNPDLVVRHRQGFVDKPQAERVADRTLSSLLLDLDKNPLGVEVDFGPPEKKGRNRYLLPVLVRIPIREISLLPNAAAEEGRLRFFLVVKDEDGGISDLHDAPYPISIPTAQIAEARERELGYGVQLEVRGGVPKVAVGVWDELSGTESFVHKAVLVGDERSADSGP